MVLKPGRDPLRNELVDLVPSGWWHTTNELRTEQGRDRARELLATFRIRDETCVIVDKASVDADDDKDGTRARGEVLGQPLAALHSTEHGTHPQVGLTVMEEHRVARINNHDRAVRAQLIKVGTVEESMTFASVSPGSEHLL